MRKLILIGLLVLVANALDAQDWLLDIEEATEIAVEKDQKVLMVFQGSDWCAPCKKLEKEIWSSEEFKSYAKQNFALLKVDFPRRRKNRLSGEQQEKNNALAEKYNLEGYFPLVVILDSEGTVLGTMGYERISPDVYIKKLESF